MFDEAVTTHASRVFDFLIFKRQEGNGRALGWCVEYQPVIRNILR
jgi:hypothetical protein